MSYQDLSGGTGRRVYFRPRRYRRRALFGSAEPVVRIADADARLIDVSLSGLACELGDGRDIATGSVVPVQLWIREERAFSARGKVVRKDGGTSRLAVHFLDVVPDPASLRTIAQRQQAELTIRDGVALYEPVPADYRVAIHDAVTVLTHWRRFLDDRERQLNEIGIRDGQSRISELETSAEKRLRIDWLRAHSRANEAVDAMGQRFEIVRAAKRLTELLVTPLLLPAPIWRHAYTKPRGYPGDFELMNYMYDEQRRGQSIYARIMHQIGREERLASTVRNRRDLLVRQIREVVSSESGGSARRICSVGAGPAREIEDLLAQSGTPPCLDIWLIDQDEDALAYAYERLRKASHHASDKVRIRCRHISFKQMLTAPHFLEELKGQDLIYSAGLFDYLSREVASSLLGSLYSLLRKQGCLFVGNAASAAGIRWVPEYVLDWNLRYRSKEEMLDLASNLPEEARTSIRSDDSNAWHFLMAVRPGDLR